MNLHFETMVTFIYFLKVVIKGNKIYLIYIVSLLAFKFLLNFNVNFDFVKLSLQNINELRERERERERHFL
jgi:hypothetical protein